MEKTKLPAGVTQEMIEQFKRDNPRGIQVITIRDKVDRSKVYRCIVRKISDRTVAIVFKFIDKDFFKACDIALKNEWLAGDEVIKTEASYVLNAGAKILEGFDTADAEIENL